MPTWIRVKDTVTGHEFDVSAEALAGMKGVERVAGHPEMSGPGARPRRAKPNTDLAGKPAAKKTAPAAAGKTEGGKS